MTLQTLLTYDSETGQWALIPSTDSEPIPIDIPSELAIEIRQSIEVNQASPPLPRWQRLTPSERARDLRNWTQKLSLSDRSLPDSAFDRADIYDT